METEEFYECPTPCQQCGGIFELTDGRASEKWYPNTVICEYCHDEEKEEIEEDERWEDINREFSDAIFMFNHEQKWDRLSKDNLEVLKKIPQISEFKIETVDRYWYYCGRNCRQFVEITYWYDTITMERKETKRSESFFPSDEWNMPDWCKSITEHRKSLDAQYY